MNVALRPLLTAHLAEAQRLEPLLRRGQGGLYRYVDRLEEADLIIWTDWPDYAQPLDALQREDFRAHLDRSFAFSQQDRPLAFLPGLYTGLSGRADDTRRGGWYLEASAPDDALDAVAVDPRERDLWFTFAGGSTSWIRKRLLRHNFRRSDVRIVNTSAFHFWDPAQSGHGDRRAWYLDQLARSRFVLCPRGACPSSIRLFETMRAGRVPVILSDAWVPPPFVEWRRFAVRVPERHFAHLPEILADYDPQAPEMGRIARTQWERWLSLDRAGETLVAALLEIGLDAARQTPLTAWTWPARHRLQALRWQARAQARDVALKAWRRSGLPMPYALNRPND
ncbi:MAG: exostosin family protein [Verrucomicrobiota bacterium JB022]|nr:exostosin family protein [Verrucomicrobiota bacterium JB022]